MKMRIKKDFLLCFLPIIAVLCFVFIAPAFADFKKVNECELARANASLTGLPAVIRCPDPSDLLDEAPDCKDAFNRCSNILADVQPAVNEDIRSSLHEDYGYDWLKNQKTVGDPYFIASPVLSPLTVESGSCGFCGTNSVYARVGLGSQEVDLDSKDITVTLGSKAASIAGGQDQILGTLYLQGLKVKTNGSSYATLCMVEGKTAIYTQVDVTIDRIDLATISWGDKDGCAEEHDDASNPSKAGYVGLKDTSITDVTASGSVSIDVANIDDHGLSIAKAVHIGIGNLNVGVASLDTTVVLGDKKDFSGNKYVLGTLYMKDLRMNVGGYLDIYNPADNDKATSLGFGLNLPWLTIDTLSWGDSDGVGDGTSAGFVGLRNLTISNLAISGVATVETLTAPVGSTYPPAGIVFIRIGLSDFYITMDSLNTEVALGSAKNNLNQVLGSVYLGGLSMDINGTVDIHPPSLHTQGIVVDLNITSKNLHMDALSWGDSDGAGGMTKAGYRGWRNVNINGLSLAGKISIEVATIDASVTPVSVNASADERLFASYGNPLNISPSYVHIGIGTGNPNDDPALLGTLVIGVNTMSWDVVLDSSRSLDSTKSLDSINTNVLRSFYLEGMTTRINGWVHIGAH